MLRWLVLAALALGACSPTAMGGAHAQMMRDVPLGDCVAQIARGLPVRLQVNAAVDTADAYLRRGEPAAALAALRPFSRVVVASDDRTAHEVLARVYVASERVEELRRDLALFAPPDKQTELLSWVVLTMAEKGWRARAEALARECRLTGVPASGGDDASRERRVLVSIAVDSTTTELDELVRTLDRLPTFDRFPVLLRVASGVARFQDVEQAIRLIEEHLPDGAMRGAGLLAVAKAALSRGARDQTLRLVRKAEPLLRDQARAATELADVYDAVGDRSNAVRCLQVLVAGARQQTYPPEKIGMLADAASALGRLGEVGAARELNQEGAELLRTSRASVPEYIVVSLVEASLSAGDVGMAMQLTSYLQDAYQLCRAMVVMLRSGPPGRRISCRGPVAPPGAGPGGG
jgi:hypothetical protein